MHKLIAAIVLVLALALFSCDGADRSADLHGTWTFSPETVEAMLLELEEADRPMARDTFEKMTWTFQVGGVYFGAGPMGAKHEGTYSVTKADGNTLTVRTEMDGQKDEQVITLDGDSFTTMMDGQEVKFVRAE